jgi:hypothetical protein
MFRIRFLLDLAVLFYKDLKLMVTPNKAFHRLSSLRFVRCKDEIEHISLKAYNGPRKL